MQAAENVRTTVRVDLTLPKLEYSEMKKLESQLFEAGARYDKWEIPKEQSRDGKTHKGKNWYVIKADDTDMTPFKEYIKDNTKEQAAEQDNGYSKDTKGKVVRVDLALPKLEYSEMKKLESQLFEAGARYDKWEIPKEQSRDGKTHKGKNWYVIKADDTDMTPFKEYIKDNTKEQAAEQDKGHAKDTKEKGERVYLKLPSDLPKEELEELSNKLFESGARYYKNTVTADKSKDGKEHTYWNWYVDKTESTDMSPFAPYIKKSNDLGISAKPKENNDMGKRPIISQKSQKNEGSKQPKHEQKESKKNRDAR